MAGLDSISNIFLFAPEEEVRAWNQKVASRPTTLPSTSTTPPISFTGAPTGQVELDPATLGLIGTTAEPESGPVLSGAPGFIAGQVEQTLPGIEALERERVSNLLAGAEAFSVGQHEQALNIPPLLGPYDTPNEYFARYGSLPIQQQPGFKSIFDILATEIPGTSAVADVVSDIGSQVGGITARGLLGLNPLGAAANLAELLGLDAPGPLGDIRELAIGAGETAGGIGGEAIVPRTVGELGIELIPGIGFAPDLARGARGLTRVGTRAGSGIAQRGAQELAETVAPPLIRRGGVLQDIGEAGIRATGARPPIMGAAPDPDNAIRSVTKAFGEQTRDAQKAALDVRPDYLPTDSPQINAMRQYQGRLFEAFKDLELDIRRGNELLAEMGIGRPTGGFGGHRFVTEEEGLDLLKALHSEGDVPPGFEVLFDDARRLADLETAATVDFDPNFIPIDDYFWRGFAQDTSRSGAGARGFGSRPGFTRQRGEFTFTEAIEAGLKPVSYNPYDMIALRRIAGVQYREQKVLLNELKDLGVAIPKGKGPLPAGYRVPDVGPAFKGKAYIREAEDLPAPVIAHSDPIAVPNNIADLLEDIYGKRPSLFVKDFDVNKFLDDVTNVTKRTKLFGSLFQQVDFSARTAAANMGGAVDALISGHPLTAVKRALGTPLEVAKLPIANLSPAKRRGLLEEIVSGDALFPNHPNPEFRKISYRGTLRQGWSGQDASIIDRSIQQALKNEVDELVSGAGVTKRAKDNARRVLAAMEAGLFDGTYPASQMSALRNLILPHVMRRHPTWTAERVMAQAATEVNKMFSTLPSYQQMIKSPAMKAILRKAIFSTNESESLLRASFSTISGPNKLLWSEFALGAFIALGTTANLMHYAATGEHLPFDRYVPVKPDQFSPFGFGYNNQFLSPQVPFIQGRGGLPVDLDLMGQLDTAFRLLDPMGFVEARENVLPRALISQITNEDFFGRTVASGPHGVTGRLKQLIADLGLPIGAGNLLEAVRAELPTLDHLLPGSGEARLGVEALAVQASGVNLRAMNNADMRDYYAREYSRVAPNPKDPSGEPLERTWEELEPMERKYIESLPAFQAEMDRRILERAESDDVQSQTPLYIQEIEQEFDEEVIELDRRFQAGELTLGEYLDSWSKKSTVKWASIDTAREIAEWDFPPPTDATGRYYEVIEQNTDLVTEQVDWDAVDRWVAQQTDDERAEIERNTGGSGTEVIRARREAFARLDADGYFDSATDIGRRWDGMPDSLDEETVDQWRDYVTRARRNSEWLAGLDYVDAADFVLKRDTDLTWKERQFIAHAEWQVHENPIREQYKREHPELMVWLKPFQTETYEDIKPYIDILLGVTE